MRVAATDRAQSEYILQVKRAEGEAETKYLSGVGVARQRQVRDCTACFWKVERYVQVIRK